MGHDSGPTTNRSIDLVAEAVSADLDGCPDVAAATDLLVGGPFLEIGGGVGRVVSELNRRGRGPITVIEPSSTGSSLTELGVAVVASASELPVEPIFSCALCPVPCALWLYAGVVDCNPSEQAAMFQQIGLRLRPGGWFVVDLPGDPLPGERGSEVVRFGPAAAYRGYVPSLEELSSYAALVFSDTEVLAYRTGTGRRRTLVCFQV